MTEERLKEIKDMIDSDYDFCRKFGIDFAIPEKELELYNEVIGLKKRNKEIYEGFLATQEEMSDYAEENEKYKSRIEKADWWLREMLKQAKSDETKAIISGTLELLLSDRSDE